MKQFVSCFLVFTLLISCSSNNTNEITENGSKNMEVSINREYLSDTTLINLGDTAMFELIELNSVNAHQFSEEELKKEKDKIRSLRTSKEYFDWDNPTSGGAVHINENDELEVYNCFLDSSTVTHKVSMDSLWLAVQGFTWGNAPSVLITSELNAHESKSLWLVVNELFKHNLRIFYITQTVANSK